MRATFVSWLFVVALGVNFGALGCRPKPKGRMTVAASVFPIYDLVRRVAGPDADVVLLQEGSATNAEAAGLARVGVMVGLGLDPWMQKALEAAAPAGKPPKILKVGDHVPTLTTTGKPFDDGTSAAGGSTVDPHVWLDPQRASVMTKAIGEELARADATHAAAYRRRADELSDALDSLDKEVETQTSAWKTRGFATREPDYGYFADRYHLHAAPAAPAAPGAVPTVTLDAVGGGPDLDSYEKLIRHDVGVLAAALR